jgi:alpha-maltose-1-phosphate synthase
MSGLNTGCPLYRCGCSDRALRSRSERQARHLQERGGIYICDRGSTHQLYQQRLVDDELRRWGTRSTDQRCARRALPARGHDLRDRRRDYRALQLSPRDPTSSLGISKGEGPRHPLRSSAGELPPGSGAAARTPSRYSLSVKWDCARASRIFSRPLPGCGIRERGLRDCWGRSARVPACSCAHLPQRQVEFMGPQPQAEVVRYMSSSHVMVLPSIEEGLALVQGPGDGLRVSGAGDHKHRFRGSVHGRRRGIHRSNPRPGCPAERGSNNSLTIRRCSGG